jgi:multicomponent Na+:H+ antiporter subunit E
MRPGLISAAFVGAAVFRATAFLLVWWVLAEGRADSWGVGIVSVLLALAASLYLLPPGNGRLHPVAVLKFAGFFLYESVRGGILVAARAFRPRLDLAPAFLDVPVSLPEGAARVLLVNTLNLLPGTVSVTLAGNHLCLHVLDKRLPVAEEVAQAEARIAALFRGAS